MTTLISVALKRVWECGDAGLTPIATAATLIGEVAPLLVKRKHQLESPKLVLGLHARRLAIELVTSVGHDTGRFDRTPPFWKPENRLAIIEQAPTPK